MSSSLYQTFYPYNKFDDNQTISQLHKWMLSKEVLAKLRFHSIEKVSITEPKKDHITHDLPLSKTSPVIFPDKMDTLFWCIYIAHYGEDAYLAIGNKYGNAEITEKQKIVEFLKSNKNVLKNIRRKITQSCFQEIMSDLMTNAKTTLLSFVAFSVYYKKHILLLNENNKTFLEYRWDDLSIFNKEENRELGQWVIIKYCENKKYGVFTESTDNVGKLISTYHYIYEPDKPLKGISTYKMGELVEIASKITALEKDIKRTKPDLYGKIWHCLLWS